MSTPPALAPTVLLGSPESSRLVLESQPARPAPQERAPAPERGVPARGTPGPKPRTAWRAA